MNLSNKRIEIFIVIVVVALVISLFFIHPTLKIMAGSVIGICIIILIIQIFNNQKYNVVAKNYKMKSTDDITVKDISDSQTNKVSIVNKEEKDFDDSSFVVVNLAEVNLNNKQSASTSKQVHTYSGDFDVESATNNTNKQELTNTQQQTIINNDNINKANELFENNISENNETNNEYEINLNKNVKKERVTNTQNEQPANKTQNIPANNIKNDNELLQQQNNPENKNTEPQPKPNITLPINNIIDVEVDIETKKDEFIYFIKHFFNIIRYYILDTNTLSFVWVNHTLQTLDFILLSSEDTDTKQAFINKKQGVKFGNDIISQIVLDKSPQIMYELNNPNIELDQFIYYTKSVGTNSFIGIPIYFEDTVIAVLCIDSKKTYAFGDGENAYSFLRNFTKLIARLINVFDSDSKQENAEQILELIGGFNKLIAERGTTFNEICETITKYIVNMYACTAIGVVSYNDNAKNWAILSYTITDSITNEINDAFIQEQINVNQTIIGKCITQNQTIILNNIPKEVIRINKYEPNINNGTFIAVPIKSTIDVYGALFIESKNNPHFASTIDINIIETICQQAGEMIEKIKLSQLYKKNVATEPKTGILTKINLQNRILEEYNKAIDTNNKLTFALISIDKYDILEEDYSKKYIAFNKIIEIVKANIKSYEIIGRIDNDVIGVIIFNKTSNQVKAIFERIRQQLATKYININNEKIIVTISVGIANINDKNDANNFINNTTNINDKKTNFNTFIADATAALRKAEEHTNYVKIFE